MKRKIEKRKQTRWAGVIAAAMLLSACSGTGEPGQSTEPATKTGKTEKETSEKKTDPAEKETKKAYEGGIINWSETVEKKELTEQEMTADQAKALTQAALSILSETMKSKSDDPAASTLISPYSLLTALAMTENGAAGNTLSQMETVLNGGIALDTINPLIASLSKRMMASEKTNINVANSIWVKEDSNYVPKSSFLEKAISYYDADIFTAPFTNQTLDAINDWCSTNTREMIPNALDRIDESAIMYLINALYFEGTWKKPYEDYQIDEDGIFHQADGTDKKTAMMRSEEQCFIMDQGKGFIKPYEDGFAFVGILPDEGVTLETLLASLREKENLQAYASYQGNYQKGNVTLPEFNLSDSLGVKEILESLGMKDAFSNQADFSEMFLEKESLRTVESGEIFINRIIQKTKMELTRTGTKAAAVTIVEVATNGAYMPPELELVFDRPFLFGIVDTKTGVPLFLGAANTLE